jgi:hypothetical protein
MLPRRAAFSLALPLLLLAGCRATGVHFVPVNQLGAARAPRPAAAVELLTEPTARPHVDLGVIEQLSTYEAAPAAWLSELRAEGGRQGCDAIVVHWGRCSAYCARTATCIVYTGDAPAGAAMKVGDPAAG